MPVKILKATEPVTVNNITALVYGQPGVGKTSLAMTGGRVLVLDFDKGTYRTSFRQDVQIIERWGDALDLLKDEETLADYDVIVIDTVGRALDFIIADLKSQPGGAKLVSSLGTPTLKGYGELKSAFVTFLSALLRLRKDVVLIAHEKEDKDTSRDLTTFRPDVSGGSYAEVVKVSDFVGRIYKVDDKTMLDFEPCERYIGKNSAAIPRQEVPRFESNGHYLADLIATFKHALNANIAKQGAVVDLVQRYRDSAQSAASLKELNVVMANLLAEKDSVSIGKACAAEMKAAAERFNAAWNKEEKKYVAKAAAPEEEEEEQAPPPPKKAKPAPAPEPEPEEEEEEEQAPKPAKKKAKPAPAAKEDDDDNVWDD